MRDLHLFALQLLALFQIFIVGQEVANPKLGEIVEFFLSSRARLFQRKALGGVRVLVALGQAIEFRDQPVMELVGNCDLAEERDDLPFEFADLDVRFLAPVVDPALRAVVVRVAVPVPLR